MSCDVFNLGDIPCVRERQKHVTYLLGLLGLESLTSTYIAASFITLFIWESKCIIFTSPPRAACACLFKIDCDFSADLDDLVQRRQREMTL